MTGFITCPKCGEACGVIWNSDIGKYECDCDNCKGDFFQRLGIKEEKQK